MHLKTSSRKWRPFCLCINVFQEDPGGVKGGRPLCGMIRNPQALSCGNRFELWVVDVGEWLAMIPDTPYVPL